MDTIIDVVTSDGERFFRGLKELERLETYVGFKAGEHFEEDGTDVVNVAFRNEFGTDEIPARPFMAQTVDNHIPEIDKMVKKTFEEYEDSMSIAKNIGEGLAEFMRQEILDGNFVPNAPATIARKGHDRPLIDTSTMMNSIESWIKKG